MRRLRWTLVLPLAITVPSPARSQGSLGATFTFEEVMIPVRDGARLQTVIMRPAARSEPLPILLRRTPYGGAERRAGR
jgi:predicted acyl esterase